MDKMSKCLWYCWTVWTVFTFWSKVADMLAEKESVHKELIMSLPMARKERATPNLFPDV